MTRARLIGGSAVVVAALLASNSASLASKLPKEPGLYAVTGSGEVQRLSGGPKWEQETWNKRSALPEKLRFFIVEQNIGTDTAPLPESITLRKVSWVRSDINSTGAISPVSGGEWAVTNLNEFVVPLSFNRVNKRSDLIVAAPDIGALEPGLYSLELHMAGISVNSRFGVVWPGANQQQYASESCVDRYHESAGVVYRPCAQQEAALSTLGLQLYMVSPERTGMGEQGPVVVKGVVVNTSNRQRSIPMLEGKLLDESGQELRGWQFMATPNEVGPGKSVSFGTVLNDAPPNVARVVVQFAQPTSSQTQ